MKMGWEIKKLKDIANIFNGNSINTKIKKEKYSYLVEGLPYIATKDVSFENRINYDNGIKIPFKEKAYFKIAPKNTTLICAEGGSAGRKIGFTNKEVCFGNKLFAISWNKTIENKFIYYFFFTIVFQKSFSEQLAGIIGGVSVRKFKELEILLPPIPEQKRIISILDHAFEAINKAKANSEQNLKNAKGVFESYLNRIFKEKGDDWQQVKLEKILLKSPRNGWSPPAKYQSSIGIPVLTLSAVTGFEFNSRYVKYTTAPIDKSAYYWIHNNELLITRSNTPELVGHVAISIGIDEPTIYPDLMMKIVPNTSIINMNFLYYMLRSEYLREQIKSDAHGANPTMKKINNNDVKNLMVAYPNMITQKQIVQKLDQLQTETKKLEEIYQKRIEDLEELKKAILQKAFNGEL